MADRPEQQPFQSLAPAPEEYQRASQFYRTLQIQDSLRTETLRGLREKATSQFARHEAGLLTQRLSGYTQPAQVLHQIGGYALGLNTPPGALDIGFAALATIPVPIGRLSRSLSRPNTEIRTTELKDVMGTSLARVLGVKGSRQRNTLAGRRINPSNPQRARITPEIPAPIDITTPFNKPPTPNDIRRARRITEATYQNRLAQPEVQRQEAYYATREAALGEQKMQQRYRISQQRKKATLITGGLLGVSGLAIEGHRRLVKNSPFGLDPVIPSGDLPAFPFGPRKNVFTDTLNVPQDAGFFTPPPGYHQRTDAPGLIETLRYGMPRDRAKITSVSRQYRRQQANDELKKELQGNPRERLIRATPTFEEYRAGYFNYPAFRKTGEGPGYVGYQRFLRRRAGKRTPKPFSVQPGDFSFYDPNLSESTLTEINRLRRFYPATDFTPGFALEIERGPDIDPIRRQRAQDAPRRNLDRTPLYFGKPLGRRMDTDRGRGNPQARINSVARQQNRENQERYREDLSAARSELNEFERDIRRVERLFGSLIRNITSGRGTIREALQDFVNYASALARQEFIVEPAEEFLGGLIRRSGIFGQQPQLPTPPSPATPSLPEVLNDANRPSAFREKLRSN